MEIEETDDLGRFEKVIRIDYRSVMNPNFAEIIVRQVIERVSAEIAKEYIAKNSSKILAGLDIDVITNLVNIEVAKQVQRDHDVLMARIDPLARSIPELNARHNDRMSRTLGR